MNDKIKGVGAAKRGFGRKSPTTKKKKKDKGPKTPGESQREFKGKIAMGRVQTKKMLAGEYDLGKKLRKKRKHHS